MRHLLTITCLLLFTIASFAHKPTKRSSGFVENKGQIRTTSGELNAAVKYLWSDHGLNVQFKNTGLAFDTYQRCSEDKTIRFHRLEMEFLGANDDSNLLARNKALEEFNFVTGKKVAKQVGVYGELVYKNLYDNVDLIANSSGDHFKYDFILKENADASEIRMEYRGFDSYSINENTISFDLSGKTLTEHIPESWITATGERIDVEYVILEESDQSVVVGFEICDDSIGDKPITIDPEVIPEWSTYHGDSLYDTANDVVSDSLGNVFIAGTTESLDMIASAGSYQSTYAGGSTDAYLIKLNQHGLRHWSTYYGGSSADEGLGVCVDNFEHVYLVGRTNSTDSIAKSNNAYQDSLAGGSDGFVVKFDRLGSFIWDSYVGGALDDNLVACEAFNNGSIHAMGNTSSPGFLEEGGIEVGTSHSGGSDAFLIQFNSSGEGVRGTYLGGSGNETAVAFQINSIPEIFVTVNTDGSTGLASSEGAYTSPFGNSDGVIFSMDTTYNVWWSSYFGGSEDDYITDICVAEEENVFYLSGYTDSEINGVETYTDIAVPSGGLDGFVGRFSDQGYNDWFTYVGGTSDDQAISLDLDRDTSLFVYGNTMSEENIDLPEDGNTEITILSGERDVFLSKYDINSGIKVLGKYFGGDLSESAKAIDVYGLSAIFFVGETNSDSSMTFANGEEPQAHQPEYGGGLTDAFITRFTTNRSTPPFAICVGGNEYGVGQGHYDPAICLGDSILISVGGGCLIEGGMWVWYADSCGGTDNFIGEGNEIWVTPDTTSNFFVRAESIDDQTSCTSITVIVEEPFEITASVTDSICEGEAIVFTADSALTYSWTGPDTLSFEGSPYSLDSASAYNLGWYYVTGTGLACVDHDSVEVTTIFPAPYVEADLFDPTCVGLSDGSITVSGLDSTITEFTWTDIESDTLFRDSLPDGFYPWYAENIYGCSTTSGFALTEPSNPIDSIIAISDTCHQGLGTAWAFLSQGWTEDFALAWSSGLDSNVVNAQNLTAGQYYIEAYNIYGCTFEDSLVIENYGVFTTAINTDSLYLEFEETVGVEVFNTPEQENATYEWTPSEGLSCADCSTPILNPDSTTMYVLQVTSQLGCTAADSIFVEREIPPPTSFIPTIFSPNSDGLNDQLCVLGNRILEVDFAIYNRWGEEVFATNQLESCWDGNHNGQPVSGALVYTFKAVLEEGKTVEESGNIQILR
jgi:gliding motility-associated-like protein